MTQRQTTIRLLLSLVALFAGSRAWAVDSAVLEAQQRRVAVVQKVAAAVCAIFPPGGGGGGSGVIISADGYALTNFHVTRGAGNWMKCGLNDGVLYDAVIVGIDPTGDVALIKLLGRKDFPHAPLGDSDKLKVGDWAYAMGNPFLLATDFQPTVTYGIISGVHRYQYPAGTFLEYTDCIQVDTSINPGNSGGPLFNDDGQLVGINGRGSFEKRGRVNSGAGYAISINQIKNFMGHLRSGRIVDHATLGATVATETDGSVVVGSILEESEAYRRGLRIDDEIVSFAGRPVRSVNQFKNILGIYPKGWKLPLVYRHKGEAQQVLVRLRALHRQSELTPKRRRRRPPQPPGKKPDGKKPGDKKPDGKRPAPRPGNPRQQRAAAPEKYKHMFVKKEGFANFYFNQREQERTLKILKELGDFSALTGPWVLGGKTERGIDFEFTLADKGIGLTMGRRAFLQLLEGEDPLDEPAGTGGLLLAVHHWKLLLTSGGKKFTEFYYLGTEPLDGGDEQVDVIVAVLTGVESRWYFNRKDGTLTGVDTRLTDDVDECEIRFGKFAEFEGVKLPRQFTVRRSGVTYATFTVERADLARGAATAAKDKKN
jgi:S1-C subfamily serine protease